VSYQDSIRKKTTKMVKEHKNTIDKVIGLFTGIQASYVEYAEMIVEKANCFFGNK
jgi:hypothetical protein